MPHVRKNMFVLINYVSLIKNYRKKYWQEPNHAIFTYKDRSEENRMGYTKQIFFFFCERRKVKQKVFGRQQTHLEECKTLPIW